MDAATGAVQAPGRGRPRKRPRVSETGPAMTTQQPQHSLSQQVQHNPHAQHPQHAQWAHDTVRGTDQDQHHHSTFSSQQLDTRSHQVQVSDATGLMNGYATAPHSQYPNTSPNLAYAPADVNVAGLSSQQTLQAPQQSQATQHRRNNAAVVGGATASQQDSQLPYYNGSSVTPATTADAAAATAITSPLPPNTSYSLASNWATPTPPANSTTVANNATSTPMMTQVSVAQSPTGNTGSGSLLPPPEGIYRTFEDLLPAVQRAAKDQGYNVVKLRASNYRDVNGENKPTRYDLVCDRGGVKYNSTAKKRNPTTRKCAQHNHDPRMATVAPGQEATPVEKQLKSLTNKMDRLIHDQADGFAKVNEQSLRQAAEFSTRLDSIERRLETLEANGRAAGLLGANGPPNMGAQNMPHANMGGAGLGNGALTNGGMANGIGGAGMNPSMGNPGMGGGGGMNGMGNSMMGQDRLSNVEARLNAMEQQGRGMELPMMDQDPTRVDNLLM
ncbi:hypothetical protein DL546_002178 [Coniochaeta pulveracea]|uniref:FAR1 domain-containing protein n=1 Tax=Coniochaeta pulveracea TaxID=177199 RepID=A0A420Y8K9_9PEZI|nr:hypothetical protein DL546_002178 [Coniochaeta pulveracea]